MFNDDGVRNHNQIQGVDEKGNLKNIKVNESGAIQTSPMGTQEVIIKEKNVKTLMCNIVSVGAEGASVEVNANVTRIELANYSNTDKVNVVVGEKTFEVGANLTLELLINDNVTTIDFSTESEEAINVQYLVEGEAE